MAVTSYKHYETAAKRHIATCAGLIEWLKLNANDSKKAKQHEDVLKDLYYLSGYIIECVYSYAVFAHMKRNSNLVNLSYPNPQHFFKEFPQTEDENVDDFDEKRYKFIRKQFDICYRKQKSSTPPPNYYTYLIARGAKDENSGIEYPAHTLVGNGGILFFADKTSDIPFINVDRKNLGNWAVAFKDVTQLNLLFENWNAEIRYEIPQTLSISKESVLDFCKLSAIIYIFLQEFISNTKFQNFEIEEKTTLSKLLNGY